MGKKLSIGVSTIARKGKKGWIGVDNKARKIKKMWIGDSGGKARLCWSGFTPIYLVFTRYSATAYSENGAQWSKGSAASAVNSCTFGFGKYFYADTRKNVFCSEDGIAWTLSRTFEKEIFLIRYCDDGYVYAFSYVSSSGNWIWRTNDGVAWEGITLDLSTFISESSYRYPLDFRYGVVGGNAAYYFIFGYITCVFRFDSMQTGATYTRLYKDWNPKKAALYICDGNLFIAECENSGSLNCFKYNTSTGHIDNFFGYSGSLVRASGTSSGMLLVTYDKKVYFVNKNGYIKRDADYPITLCSVEGCYQLFAGAWDGRDRVVIMDRSNSDTLTLRCVYTDDYGLTWTIAETYMGESFDVADGCYGMDGGGYYSG